MPISNTKYLFGLIKSLTKADKRNFKLYAKRIQSNDRMKFIRLFEVLDKQKELDEDRLLSKLPGIDKGQLSNLKRHLYKQILTSLRLIYINRIDSIEVREQIDFAHVLYSKGLYQQSLKILERAKRIADMHNLRLLALEIIEFQKIIESRHITNTGPLKNEALTAEAQTRIDKVYMSISLSNLRVRLHSWYIKNSHVKNHMEREEIIRFFERNIPDIKEEDLREIEQIYFYQCHVWYYYILLDFEQCFEYALKWIQVFEENEELILLDPDLYMRGLHYLLTAAYNLGDQISLERYLEDLDSFRKSNYGRFKENSKIFSFLYVHWARYNGHFLRGTFQEGLHLIPRTLRRISRYKDRIAPHRIMVLYYKIAWMYMGSGQPGKAITYLTKILNEDDTNFREDIQAYSRLLYLMAHFDLDNIDLLPYLVNTAETFFKKAKSKNKLQVSTLSFFKKISNLSISDRLDCLEEFQEVLELIQKDPFEKRAFIYLDISSWVQSKLTKKPIGSASVISIAG